MEKIHRSWTTRQVASFLLITSLALLVPYALLPQPKDGFHYTVIVEVKRAGSDIWEPLFKGVFNSPISQPPIDAGWILISARYNVFTNIGKNFTRDELGSGSASTNVAKYISLSEDSGTASALWTQLPSEIASGGLTRATGTYTALAGNGTWKIENTFAVTLSFTVRLTGLHWGASGNNNMIACAAVSPIATVANGDSLKITWTNSAT